MARRTKPFNFRPVVAGRVYRSNCPDSAPPEEAARWFKELGIRRIIDMRSKSDIEHIAPGDRLSHLFPMRDPKDSGQPHCHHGRFPINLDGIDFYRRILSDGAWYHTLIMFLLILWALVTRDKSRMIAYGAKHLLAERGLHHAYILMMDCSQSGMRKVFRAILDCQGAPFVVSCMAGKDRTGVVCALIMELAGFSSEEIVSNYHETEAAMAPIQHLLDEYFRSRNFPPEEFAKAPPEAIKAMLDHLREKYGNTEGYLRHLGFTEHEIEKIRQNVTA